jgi:hypothetical protein
MRLSRVAITMLFLAACGDDKPAVDAFYSICGNPGDTGNELGVGRFCREISDCAPTTNAKLCANLGDPAAFFCTRTCNPMMDVMQQCGTATTCTCNNGGSCGCTPNSCLQ